MPNIFGGRRHGREEQVRIEAAAQEQRQRDEEAMRQRAIQMARTEASYAEAQQQVLRMARERMMQDGPRENRPIAPMPRGAGPHYFVPAVGPWQAQAVSENTPLVPGDFAPLECRLYVDYGNYSASTVSGWTTTPMTIGSMSWDEPAAPPPPDVYQDFNI